MELAKLLLMHRRTDFWQIMRMYNRIMRPDYYEQEDRKAKQSLAKLFAISSVLSNYGWGTNEDIFRDLLMVGEKNEL